MAEKESGIRALERGLAMLEELNLCDGARPTTLSRSLGLPRSTVYRILETLEELQYVERSASDSRFRVTDRVWLLSRGFTRTRLGSVAGPFLRRLTSTISWPLDVSAYDAGMMYTQETTNGLSPMSMARSMVGMPLPLLRTASGRAVFAFSPPDQRDAMLALVRDQNDPADLPYLEPRALNELVEKTTRRGFSIRTGEGVLPTSYSDRTSSIGVPIMHEERVVGAIVVIWITSALPMSEAVETFFPPLSDTASEISSKL